jgi:hypothetical protein
MHGAEDYMAAQHFVLPGGAPRGVGTREELARERVPHPSPRDPR